MTLTQGSIEQFLNSLSVNGASKNTIRGYKADLRGLHADVGDVEPSVFDVTAADYLTRNRADVAARTTQRRLAAFRAYAKWAGIPNALAMYRPPTPAKPEAHPIPEGIDGVLRMIEAGERHEQRALVALCGLCGLRVNEATDVRVDGVDLTLMTLHVFGKGAKERNVPLTATAWKWIAPAYAKALVEGRETILPFGERRARYIITRLAEVAGLSAAVASHDLRATFGTAAYDKTKDLRAVQELLGHASPDTTVGYTGISMDKRREAADVA